MNWLEHLSWSHAAALLICVCLLMALGAALFSGDPDYDIKDEPHHSCKRNGPESVP